MVEDGTLEVQDSGGTAKLIYILYLVGVVIGITGIVGVIIAYVNKGDGPAWLNTHYRFQIRTFWIGLLYSLIGGLLMFAFYYIGFLVWLFCFVWYVVRCSKGMRYLRRNEPHPNPDGWLF